MATGRVRVVAAALRVPQRVGSVAVPPRGVAAGLAIAARAVGAAVSGPRVARLLGARIGRRSAAGCQVPPANRSAGSAQPRAQARHRDVGRARR